MKSKKHDPLDLLRVPEGARSAALMMEVAFEAGLHPTGWLNMDASTRAVFVSLLSRQPERGHAIWDVGVEALIEFTQQRIDGVRIGLRRTIPLNPAEQSVHGLVLNWGRCTKEEIKRAAAAWAAREWEKRNGKLRKRQPSTAAALAELAAFKMRRNQMSVGDTAAAVNVASDATHDDRWVRRAVRNTRRRVSEVKAAHATQLREWLEGKSNTLVYFAPTHARRNRAS